MANNQYTATSVRKLVDKYFSLQWCRDNLVVPLYIETSLPMEPGIIKIAIANYSYLGTIAEPIKARLRQSGQKCEFVERSQEEIQEILDLASEERFISGDSIELSQFDEDAVFEAIKATTDSDEGQFDFEFDDDEGGPVEEDDLDLATEMLESKIQNFSAICDKNAKSIIFSTPCAHQDSKMTNFLGLSALRKRTHCFLCYVCQEKAPAKKVKSKFSPSGQGLRSKIKICPCSACAKKATAICFYAAQTRKVRSNFSALRALRKQIQKCLCIESALLVTVLVIEKVKIKIFSGKFNFSIFLGQVKPCGSGARIMFFTFYDIDIDLQYTFDKFFCALFSRSSTKTLITR